MLSCLHLRLTLWLFNKFTTIASGQLNEDVPFIIWTHPMCVLYTWFSAFVEFFQMRSASRWYYLGSHDIVICSYISFRVCGCGFLKVVSVATSLDFLTNCPLQIASVMCTRRCVYINIGIYTYYKCVKNNCLLFCLCLLLGVMPLEHFTALCKEKKILQLSF